MARDPQGRIVIPDLAGLDLRLGEYMHLVREEGRGYAAVSYRGIGYVDEAGRLKHNEDRHLIMNFSDGRRVSVIIDGAGGHEGGERAAEIGIRMVERALTEGESMEDAIDLAHRAIVQDNQNQGIRAHHPFAVLIASELTPQADGNTHARFFTLGDAEAVVLRPLADHSAPPEIIHWTLRPSPAVQMFRSQQGVPMIPTLPDGRITRGQTLIHHTAWGANVPNGGIGGNGRSFNGRPHITEVVLQRGDSIFLASDGGTESLSSYDVISHLPFYARAVNEVQIRDVLFLETLICMDLARQQLEAGAAIELTHERYVAAYQAATGEAPPEGWRGAFEGHTLGTDLHVRNARGQTVGSFKPDNVTMIVQTVGAEAPVCESPPASTSEPGPSASPPPPPVVVIPPPRAVTAGDSGETQVISSSLRQAMEFFTNLRTAFVEMGWVRERLQEVSTIYTVFDINETPSADASIPPSLTRGLTAFPEECPAVEALNPNHLVLEITRGPDGPRVRLVGFNRGSLSEDTVTALLARFPAADDLTQRFSPAIRQAVQNEERVISLVDLLDQHVRMGTRHRVAIPIYWTPEGGFSINPPSDHSLPPLGTLFREPMGDHFRLRYEWVPTPPDMPAEIPSIVSQALQRLIQRHSRRRP